MRDYGKVHTSIWSSSSMRSMSEDGRTLALYLLTSPHSTIAGVFRLPDGYACEDLQWSAERVEKGFTELLVNGFANRCETTKWVWVQKHFLWNPPENPNQVKAAAKCVALVPAECAWKTVFLQVNGPLLGLGDAFEPGDGCETLSEGLPNQEQEQEQEQEQKKEKAKAAPSLTLEELKAEGLSEETAAQFLTQRKRKRAPLTALAWDGIKAEIAKAGWTAEAAIRKALARGWTSFEAEWVKDAKQKLADVAHMTVPGAGPSTFLADQAAHRAVVEAQRIARKAQAA